MVHQIFTRSLLAAAVLGAYTHGFAADEVSNTELETVSVVLNQQAASRTVPSGKICSKHQCRNPV